MSVDYLCQQMWSLRGVRGKWVDFFIQLVKLSWLCYRLHDKQLKELLWRGIYGFLFLMGIVCVFSGRRHFDTPTRPYHWLCVKRICWRHPRHPWKCIDEIVGEKNWPCLPKIRQFKECFKIWLVTQFEASVTCWCGNATVWHAWRSHSLSPMKTSCFQE